LGPNNSALNHIHITSDPGRYNDDSYASSFISETPTIRYPNGPLGELLRLTALTKFSEKNWEPLSRYALKGSPVRPWTPLFSLSYQHLF
jgi:hypothetical protein